MQSSDASALPNDTIKQDILTQNRLTNHTFLEANYKKHHELEKTFKKFV